MSPRVEVLVVGGGIIGASCAYYLSNDGKQVTLIEREASICPVGASSYANAGLVMPSSPSPLPSPGVLGQGFKWLFDSSSPLYIKPRPSPALARWLVRFVAASRESRMRRGMPVLRALGAEGLKAFDQLDALGTLDAGYHHTGILSLYLTQERLQGAAAGAAQLEDEFGVKTEILDAAAVHERVPACLSEVVGGAFTAEDGHVEPCKLTRELARLAAEQGATVLTATEALGFRREGRRVTGVMTTRGMLQPETVVLAAGVWSGQLAHSLRLSLPLQPAKGYSITVQRPEGVPDDMALYLPEGHVCVTPFGDDLRFAGTLEFSGMNDRVLTNRLAGIREGAGRFFAGVEKAVPLALWRGLRPMTPDGLPIIGRTAAHDNLVVATGHNMNGIMYGPITGRLVAEIVGGRRPSVDLGSLCAERFGPCQAGRR
jgi:D-amino-acid dehydrogenase